MAAERWLLKRLPAFLQFAAVYSSLSLHRVRVYALRQQGSSAQACHRLPYLPMSSANALRSRERHSLRGWYSESEVFVRHVLSVGYLKPPKIRVVPLPPEPDSQAQAV